MAAALGLTLGLVAACTQTDSAPDAAAEPPCETDLDCTSGSRCFYPRADGCAATGHCRDVRDLNQCAAYEAACGCDGTAVNVACPLFPGFAGARVAYEGPCAEAGAGDAGSGADSGGS